VATRRARAKSHVPVFRRLVHVHDGDVIAKHIYDGSSVQISGRDVVLLNRLSRDDGLVQFERRFGDLRGMIWRVEYPKEG
jgi:hypothetical protein